MKPTNQLILALLSEISAGRAQNQTLREHLSQRWRLAIASGQLPAGVALPGSRALASSLGVGRSTLIEVIEQLALEGYLVTHPGAATRVATLQSPEGPTPLTPPPAVQRPLPQGAGPVIDDPPTPVRLRAFRPGLPDLQAFPFAEFSRHLVHRARRPQRHDLSYDRGLGVPELREQLLAHLRQHRAVRADPGQVLILPSAQACFDLVARAALQPGDSVWVEDPGYGGFRSAARLAGATLYPVAIDTQGLVLPKSEAPIPRLIQVTPSHQYPTGVMLSVERRLALLALARQYQALIVEDDYDSEYQFEGRPLASLQGLDTAECVAYVGTFSKTLAPGLRVAYLIAPPAWVERLEALALISGHGVSIPIQLALADYLAEGGFRRHLRRMNQEASARMRALIQSLQELKDPRLIVPSPRGGLQVTVGWRGQTPDQQLVEILRAEGIYALALSSLCLRSPPQQGLVLGIGLTQRVDIEPAVLQIGRVLHALL